MDKLKTFLQQTKISSRVLFGLWIFFSAICNFTNESKFLEIFDFAVFFLFPALVNELCKNPIFEDNKSSFFIFIRNTKTISRILFQLWAIELLFMLSSPVDFPFTFLAAAIMFLFPIFLIERKNQGEDINTFTEKTVASSTIRKTLTFNMKYFFGIIFLIDFLACIIAFIRNPVDNPTTGNQASGYLSMAIFFGFITLLLFKPFILQQMKKIGILRQEDDTKIIIVEDDCDFSPVLSTDISMDDVLMEETVVDDELDIFEELDDDTDEFDPCDVSMVDGMDGHAFEYFCADLLRKNDFTDVSVTKGSGDQGVDILATKGGVKYAIQCKNYASSLGNTPVQEVSAGKIFYNCHVGVVLTNSTFTSSATSLANATGVLLWDRNVLSELMKVECTNKEKQEKRESDSYICPPKPNREIKTLPKAIIQTENLTYNNVQKSSIEMSQKKRIVVDNIEICIDINTMDQFNILLNDFGIETDEDGGDGLELLFDVFSRNGRTLPCDIDIVCNLYANTRKIATENECLYKDDFRKRDSRSIYFSKRNIGKMATKIELYAKKG